MTRTTKRHKERVMTLAEASEALTGLCDTRPGPQPEEFETALRTVGFKARRLIQLGVDPTTPVTPLVATSVIRWQERHQLQPDG